MDLSWIEPETLAAGGVPISAKDIGDLHAAHIRAILSLTERPITAYKEITPDLLERLDIVYYHVPVRDQFPPSVEQARQIIQIIDEMAKHKRPIFLHCHAGVGRTGTALHLYYLAQGYSFIEAQALVRARRVQCILLSETQEKFIKEFVATSS